LLSHTDFPSPSFRKEKIRPLDDSAHRMRSRRMDLTEPSTVFRVSTTLLRRSLQRGQVDPRPLGRHQAWDADVESDLLRLLLESFRDGHTRPQSSCHRWDGKNTIPRSRRIRFTPSLARTLIHFSCPVPFSKRTDA
jgi:hypothetical protein